MGQEGITKKSIAILLSAVLYLSPASGSFTVGDTFDVSIMVNSSEKAINAGQAGLTFANDKLAIQSISKGNSIFSLWTQSPDFSNTAGTINFSGGLPSPGFVGSSGKILNIKFKAKELGQAEISFQKGARVLANDGKGTNILANTTDANFVIKEKEAPPVVPKPPEAPPAIPPEIVPEVPPVAPLPPEVAPEVIPPIVPPAPIIISSAMWVLIIIVVIIIIGAILAVIIYTRPLLKIIRKVRKARKVKKAIKKYSDKKITQKQINKTLKKLERFRER